MRGVLHGGARHTLHVGVTVHPAEERRSDEASQSLAQSQSAQSQSQSQNQEP